MDFGFCDLRCLVERVCVDLVIRRVDKTFHFRVNGLNNHVGKKHHVYYLQVGNAVHPYQPVFADYFLKQLRHEIQLLLLRNILRRNRGGVSGQLDCKQASIRAWTLVNRQVWSQSIVLSLSTVYIFETKSFSIAFPFNRNTVAQIEKIRREKIIRQAEGYLDLIMCLEDQWRLDEPIIQVITGKALKVLDELDETSGRRSHVAFLRGQTFRVRRDYQNAVVAFEESLENDYENIHTHLGMAWCYKRMNMIDSAIGSLNHANEIEPENAIVLYNLACYWALAGNVLNCCEHLHYALELEGGLRELIDAESDFDLVRRSAEFQSITSAIV